jgi:signal transduction histidine kinase
MTSPPKSRDNSVSSMSPSVRRRLLAIAALAAVASVGALLAIWQVARTTTEQRSERGRDIVTAELERLAAVVSPAPIDARGRYGLRGFGDLHSGFTESQAHVDRGSPNVVAAVKQSAESGQTTILSAHRADGTPIVVGAMPVPGGGYVWAAMLIATGREAKTFRGAVLLAALLSLALVLGSIHTGVMFARDVSSLRRSIAGLGKDLLAPVAQPKLRELQEVAEGVKKLARDLLGAQDEREALTRQLAERERLAALGRVVAGVAHEVRNPLASIKLRADLALGAADASSALATDLGEIADEVSRLDRLVADLLIVAGGKGGPRTEVDLAALARKRATLMEPWATEKTVALRVEGVATARVDGDAIARVVDNLLRNAVEASPAGASVDVTLAADGTGARLSVFDHGSGVPDDRASELFEPFFTTKPTGTGLGLALSRAVAAAHGGTLAYAREATLTRFTLTIPRSA